MKRLTGRRVFAALVAAAIVLAALVLAGTSSLWTASAAPPLAQSRPEPGATSLTSAQLTYLALAEQGVSKTPRWWDGSAAWYVDTLHDHRSLPLATLWDTNGLFETLDEIALAEPTARNLLAVRRFADLSERFWNSSLRPTPGYASYIGDGGRHEQTWYDDNGWLGLAFLDAYRATHVARYLSAAERAFTFIAAGGWDAADGGGMWWSTTHPWRSGEALAAAADLAARLYQQTRKPVYLAAATEWIGWANAHLLQAHGVYLRTADTPYPDLIEPKTPARSVSAGAALLPSPPPTLTRTPTSSSAVITIQGAPQAARCRGVKAGRRRCPAGAAISFRGSGPPRAANATPTMVAMPHDGEGAMLSAGAALCEATTPRSSRAAPGSRTWCSAAERLAGAAIVWLAPFSDGPQYDSVLVRGLLALYARDHNARWYRFAVAIAHLITAHAETAPGVYLRGWDGRPVPGATPGMLRTDAGSLSVFADLATVRAP